MGSTSPPLNSAHRCGFILTGVADPQVGPTVTYGDCLEVGRHRMEPWGTPTGERHRGRGVLGAGPDKPSEAAVTAHRGREGAGGLNNDKKGKKWLKKKRTGKWP